MCWKIWIFSWIGFGILWVLVWIGVRGFWFFGLDRRRHVAITSRIPHVDSSSTVTVTKCMHCQGIYQAMIQKFPTFTLDRSLTESKGQKVAIAYKWMRLWIKRKGSSRGDLHMMGHSLIQPSYNIEMWWKFFIESQSNGVSCAGVWHFCEFKKIFLAGFNLLGLVLDLKLRLDFDFVLGFDIFVNLKKNFFFFFFLGFDLLGFGFGFEAEIGGCGWLRWWLEKGRFVLEVVVGWESSLALNLLDFVPQGAVFLYFQAHPSQFLA